MQFLEPNSLQQNPQHYPQSMGIISSWSPDIHYGWFVIVIVARHLATFYLQLTELRTAALFRPNQGNGQLPLLLAISSAVAFTPRQSSKSILWLGRKVFFSLAELWPGIKQIFTQTPSHKDRRNRDRVSSHRLHNFTDCRWNWPSACPLSTQLSLN